MFGTDDLSSCEIFHLIAKNQFTSSIGREDLEERDVLLKVLQSLEFMHELHVGKTGFRARPAPAVDLPSYSTRRRT